MRQTDGDVISIHFSSYSQQDAVGDLVAGITVGLTVIPQALAYAGIAGLDPAVSFFSINFLWCKEFHDSRSHLKVQH